MAVNNCRLSDPIIRRRRTTDRNALDGRLSRSDTGRSACPAVVDAGLTSRSGIPAFRSRDRPSESWHARSVPILDRLSPPVSTCCSSSEGCSASVYLTAETYSWRCRASFLLLFLFNPRGASFGRSGHAQTTDRQRTNDKKQLRLLLISFIARAV